MMVDSQVQDPAEDFTAEDLVTEDGVVCGLVWVVEEILDMIWAWDSRGWVSILCILGTWMATLHWATLHWATLHWATFLS